MRRTRRSGVLRGAVGVIALPVVALTVAAALVAAVRAEDRAERAGAAADAVTVRALVWEMGRAQLQETNLAALGALGRVDEGTVAAARRLRVEARERAARRLGVLADAEGDVGAAARAILEVLEDQDLSAAAVPLDELWDSLVELQSEAAAQDLEPPEASAVGDLGEVGLIAWYVLSDAIDASFTRDPQPVPPTARAYFRNSVEYVRGGDAGWLADDEADPFSGTWVPRGEVRRHLPDAEDGLTVAFATSAARDVVLLDDWVKAATGAGEEPIAPPPLSLDRARDVADDLGAELSAVVQATVRSETERFIATAEGERAAARRLAALGGLALVAAVVAMAWVLRRRRARISALEEAAETDGLTGLANRRAVQRRVPERLADPERGGHAVIQLDLDRFKAVNDTYGHRVGDELLLAFAGRTAGVLARRFADRDGDVEFARVGGDEFLIVLHDSTDPRTEAHGLVADIEAAFRSPIACGPVRIRVELSGGIAVAVGPTDLDRLLLEADIALYQAKAARHSSFEVFEEPALRDIMRDFPTRVADGAVRADLQPQFDLVTGEVVGFEALARWSADDGDPVPAAVWIKAVEQLGGADLLFAAVARSVADAVTMVGDRFAGRYWLNLSPLQLGEAGSAERLLGHLDAAGLTPGRVGLEVVETAAVNDLGLAAENLEALRAAGVAVALDDFGSGFTPLGHLTALPVDLLKLDRSVVAALDNRPRQAALVEAMVTIAERLGIGLVAEGIETAAERDTLLTLGVRCGQGYLLGHPAPPAAAVDLLDEGPLAVLR